MANELFTTQADGYNREEVDSYIANLSDDEIKALEKLKADYAELQNTYAEKAELLDRLACTDYDAEHQFARYYNLSELEEDSSYKVFWYLTDHDVDHYSRVMRQMELKTYNEC